ncbi:MAG: thymidine phosphorylase [Candidatus Neomarinimicrobiota bacterium]
MNIAHLVEAKRSGHSHSSDEIKSIIHAYSRGDVPDDKMSSWVKAVHSQGMSDEEIIALVDAMLTSGERMDFSNISKFVADKHSTGGVGDKVSLVLGPLMAAAGLAIPMISGRSLGHTGGTLDKLESIPGYRTNLSISEFRATVETVGIGMIGQTDEICPADRKMYALRDAIGITKSIPFICGSIMSKKIAEGIQGLVMDVKVGAGAFMKTVEEARELAEKLTMIGKHFGISIDVIFSDMSQPLGNESGLWNEIQESILTLKGGGPEDLSRVTFKLGGSLLRQADMASNDGEARDLQIDLIKKGKAYRKFLEMVEAQGGSPSSLDRPDYYAAGRYMSQVIAPKAGYITSMETLKIGQAVNHLTVMRKGKIRRLDPAGGVQFKKKIGDQVDAGETLALCFGGDEKRVKEAALDLARLTGIGEEPVAPRRLFYS